MADTTVQLGDLVFTGLEVPESIPWGGDQALVVQRLVGGARVIDAMGRDDMPLTWSGIFLGAAAFDRAQYVNSQRVAGQALTLSWGGLNFTVVVRTFRADYRLAVHIPYEITCEVVTDNVTATTPGIVPNVDDQMDSDMTTSLGLGQGIGDSTLNGLLGTLNTAISGVSTFANASQSVIASVLTPIAAVQGQVQTLLAAAINTAQNVASVGGVLPGSPILQNVNSLASQVTAYQQQPLLLNLQSVMGRMAANASSVGTNSRSVVVGGGNLFNLASKQYGDPTSWTAIAKANGLTDPQLSGIQTIIVPMQPDNAGGFLGQ